MTHLVVMGASLSCTFGDRQGTLKWLPRNRPRAEGQPAANILDHRPLVNISPFGRCRASSNPQVIAATAAAMGVLTPVPCVPLTLTPWSPGAAGCRIARSPALDKRGRCQCHWGGVISIVASATGKTLVN